MTNPSVPPIILYSRIPAFLVIVCVLFVFIGISMGINGTTVEKLIGLIAGVGALTVLVIGITGKLVLEQENFIKSTFGFQTCTCWGDTEDFKIQISSRGNLKSIVWSDSDKLRLKLGKELLKFRATGYDRAMWAYWGGYEPDKLITLMNKFRESYRKNHDEPTPIFPIWEQSSNTN